jgi:hypothetical protein
MAGASSGQDDTRAGEATASPRSGSRTAPANGADGRRSGAADQAGQTSAGDRGSAGDYFKSAWPVFLAGLPALVTLVALTFDLFPALRPVTPPEVRRVQVSNAAVVERQRTQPDGEVVNVVFFDVEAVGYDADGIEVATLWIDEATRRRIEPDLQRHGILTTNTRTDRVVGWVDVPYPFALPPDSSGCLFVRVLLYVAPEEGEAEAIDRAPYLLDYADTTPFDPYDLGAGACAPVLGTATPSA